MSRSIYLATLVTVLVATYISPTAAAKELSGTYSPEQIKGACDKVGGEYFPQGQTGTYGCENHKNGSMVLCNKENKCTGYTQSRTRRDDNRIVRDLKLEASVATK